MLKGLPQLRRTEFSFVKKIDDCVETDGKKGRESCGARVSLITESVDWAWLFKENVKKKTAKAQKLFQFLFITQFLII